MDERRSNALAEFRKKLLEHREVEAAVKECNTYFCYSYPASATHFKTAGS
jgi:hypothetical protein